LTYRITFAVGGRARFLSHLETVDTLLGALRRAGFDIALSKGMRPRPVISLALPRAVGVETLADIVAERIEGIEAPFELLDVQWFFKAERAQAVFGIVDAVPIEVDDTTVSNSPDLLTIQRECAYTHVMVWKILLTVETLSAVIHTNDPKRGGGGEPDDSGWRNLDVTGHSFEASF
jgi:hypothetical protein